MTYTLHNGDCLDVLRTLPDASIGAMVTDPPAGIAFMNQAWDKDKGGRDAWIAWMADVMREALRVLKPGAHALVWAIPRTSHWTATALELAGFEIRDVVTHHFGSGFPKNMDVAKAIDKAVGASPVVVGTAQQQGAKFKQAAALIDNGGFNDPARQAYPITRPASEIAQAWQGWGTALKPASEHWLLCRKPPAGTIAANVLAHGVGAINVDGCRIDGEKPNKIAFKGGFTVGGETGRSKSLGGTVDTGRWPANLILTHSEACGLYCAEDCPVRAIGDEARFFKRFTYTPKPTVSEKEAGLDGFESANTKDGRQTEIDNPYQRGETLRRNVHPTVKSLALMDYLIRLITPPGETVIDPFMGSGSTGVAAIKGGWGFVGIEKEEAFHAIASARIEAVASNRQIGLFDGREVSA